MKDNEEIMDKIYESLESSRFMLSDAIKYEASNIDDKPKLASYYSVDISVSDYTATDTWGDFTYSSTQEMREQILKLIGVMWSDEMLELFREKKIDNLTFRIGPRTLSGEDLAELF